MTQDRTHRNTTGKITGLVIVGPMTRAKAELFSTCIPAQLRPRDVRVIPNAHGRYSVNFRVEYGPVVGGWKSDVRDPINRTLARIGSSAGIQVENLQRERVA